MNSDTRESHRDQAQKVTDAQVADRAKRRLTGAGLGVPVLLTLMSRPAIGGQCLSNMLSGNLSDPDRGHCSKGWSPGGWGQPGGTVGGLSTLSAWTKAGFAYGTLKSGQNANQWSSYKGGSKMAQLPFSWPDGLVSSELTMREVIANPTYSSTTARSYAVAYLNACLSRALSPSGFQYILTPEQVIGLINGTIPLPPPYISVKSFLHSTWD